MKLSPRQINLSFASVLLVLITTTTALAEPSARTIDQVKRGVVSIATFDQDGKPLLLGGGFFVESNRLVTSIHVLKGASRVTIRTFDGQSYLVEGIVAALEAGLDHGGASIDDYLDARGERGSMQDEFLVHTREGEPCLRPPSEHRPAPPPVIVRIVVSGRSTYFCPNCQERLRRRPRRKAKRRAGRARTG